MNEELRVFLGAAALLSLERAYYIWLCRAPERFAAICRVPFGARRFDPVLGVEILFYGFKVIQFGVIAWWCLALGDGRLWPVTTDWRVVASGTILIASGQALNALVFRTLGRPGVFYAGQFGQPVPWHSGFPFSISRHPQYIGAVASIWGALIILRYPAPDWIVLPLLETFYYWLSTKLEYYGPSASMNATALAPEN